MRGPAYVAAVIAAVGIMLVIAREPADQNRSRFTHCCRTDIRGFGGDLDTECP